jgi:hypothetical protein
LVVLIPQAVLRGNPLSWGQVKLRQGFAEQFHLDIVGARGVSDEIRPTMLRKAILIDAHLVEIGGQLPDETLAIGECLRTTRPAS